MDNSDTTISKISEILNAQSQVPPENEGEPETGETEDETTETEEERSNEPVSTEEEDTGDTEPDVGSDEGGSEEAADYDEIPVDILADLLGVDDDRLVVEDDGSVKVKAIVDGEEILVKPSELVKSFQLEKHVQWKSQQVSEEKRKVESDKQQTLQEWGTKLAEAQQLLQQAAAQIQAESDSVDWDTLREEDPAEYAVKRQSMLEKQMQLQQQASMVQQQMAAYQQAAFQQQAQFIEEQKKVAVELIPEWKDEARRKQEVTAIMGWLKGQGFTDDDLSSIVDARQVVVIRKAWLADQGEQKLQKAKPKTVKVVRSTRRRTTKELKAKSLDKKKERLRKTGSREAAEDLLKDIL